jgi:pyrroline-5-carboxylate reductase
MEAAAKPVLLIGAGHMGGALIAGWRLAGVLAPDDLIVRDPSPGREALAAAAWGAALNGPGAALAAANTVVLAVGPAAWRQAAEGIAPYLAKDAVVVSIVAGVAERELSAAFAGRPVARVMPTTAAAIGRCAASVWAKDVHARRRAHALFEALGAVVDLPREEQLHAATGACGSAPAYFYALVEALQSAGASAGLEPDAARVLARGALTGAAALLEASGQDAGDLRREVASPGGTTQAALGVLMGADGLGPLMERTVAAAVARSMQLGASR